MGIETDAQLMKCGWNMKLSSGFLRCFYFHGVDKLYSNVYYSHKFYSSSLINPELCRWLVSNLLSHLMKFCFEFGFTFTYCKVDWFFFITVRQVKKWAMTRPILENIGLMYTCENFVFFLFTNFSTDTIPVLYIIIFVC